MHGGLSQVAAPSRASRLSYFTMDSDTYSDGDDGASTDAEAADVHDRVSSWGLEASLSILLLRLPDCALRSVGFSVAPQ